MNCYLNYGKPTVVGAVRKNKEGISQIFFQILKIKQIINELKIHLKFPKQTLSVFIKIYSYKYKV